MAFATLPLTPLTPVLSSDLGAAVPLVALLVIQGSTIGGGCFGTLECCLLIFSSKNPFHTHFKTLFSKWMAQEGRGFKEKTYTEYTEYTEHTDYSTAPVFKKKNVSLRKLGKCFCALSHLPGPSSGKMQQKA